MGRQITCPAGQWTVIFDHAFVQLPNAWSVSFTLLHDPDGTQVEGEVIETRSSWIFPQPPKSIPLLPLMLFKRGYWNTFYAMRVKPSHDLIAQIQLAAQ